MCFQASQHGPSFLVGGVDLVATVVACAAPLVMNHEGRVVKFLPSPLMCRWSIAPDKNVHVSFIHCMYSSSCRNSYVQRFRNSENGGAFRGSTQKALMREHLYTIPNNLKAKSVIDRHRPEHWNGQSLITRIEIRFLGPVRGQRSLAETTNRARRRLPVSLTTH